MHVLIDATCISDQTFGTSQYALCLLQALSELDRGIHYTVLVKHLLDPFHPVFRLTGKENFTFIKTPIRIGGPQQQLKFFLSRNRVKADIFHCLTYNMPLLFNKYCSICTIHDLKFIVHPEYMHSMPNFKKWYFYHVTRLSCKRAAKIIAVSKATRSDLIQYLGVNADKIQVIGEASTLRVADVTTDDEKETFCRSLGISGRFFLILGCRRPHKNIENALRGFAHFVQSRIHEDWQVVVTGSTRSYTRGISIPEDFKDILRNRLVCTGYLSEEKLDIIYRRAHALLYPSLFEGFGLPILEAMERGTPVITSDRSSMPEVAGGAALLVDPTDFRSIAQAMEELTGESVYRDYQQKGYRRSALFSWQRTARATLSVYHQVCRYHSSKGKSIPYG